MGNVKAWVANGGKKKVAAHGFTATAVITAVIVFINSNYGSLTGLADIPALKQKADTVVTLVEKTNNINEKVGKIEAGQQRIEDLIIQQMVAQGIKPKNNSPLKSVVVYYRDSLGAGVIQREDTVFVPQED